MSVTKIEEEVQFRRDLGELIAGSGTRVRAIRRNDTGELVASVSWRPE